MAIAGLGEGLDKLERRGWTKYDNVMRIVEGKKEIGS